MKKTITIAALVAAAAASTPLYAVDPLRPQDIIVVDEGTSREITAEEKEALLKVPSQNTYVIVKDGLGTLTVTDVAADAAGLIRTPLEVREGTLALTNSTLNITSYPFGITVSGDQANLVLDNSTLDLKRTDGIQVYQVSATVGGMDGDGSVTLKNGSTWIVEHSLFTGACTITWQGAPTELNPGSYESTDTSSTDLYRPNIPANKDSVGKIEVLSGSSLQVGQDLYLYGKGSSLTVSGEGSTVSATIYSPNQNYGGYIVVGRQSLSEEGQTTLNVLDGGKVSADVGVILGDTSGDYGVVNISGTNSVLDTAKLRVGYSGTGEMTISDGGKATATGGVMVGVYSGSNGALSVSGAGSSLETASSYVGYYGSGEMTISDGGTATVSYAEVGRSSGSHGVLSVSGAESSLEAAQLFVGNQGTGEIAISDGGKATATSYVVLGFDSGSHGALSISGAGSSLETAELYVGCDGTGEMTISDGGKATAGSVYVNSASSLAITGGTLVVSGNDTVDAETSETSSVLQNKGTISIDASAGKIQLTGDSATISNTGKFVISAGTMNAGTTATVVTDKSGAAVVLEGTVNAFGGTYENGVFTAGAKETVDESISSDKTVAAGCRIEVTHLESTVVLSTTTEAITVSKAESIATAEVVLPKANETVVAAWSFEITKAENTEVMVTLDVGPDVGLDSIRVYHKANDAAEWNDVTGTDQISNVTLSEGKLCFITKSFSSYAAAIIPEPSAFGLFAGLGALALVASRRRRQKKA